MNKYTRWIFGIIACAIVIIIAAVALSNVPMWALKAALMICCIVAGAIVVNKMVSIWNSWASKSQKKKHHVEAQRWGWRRRPPSRHELEREPWLASLLPDEPEHPRKKAPPEECIPSTLAERKAWLVWIKATFRLPSSRKGN